MKFKKLIVVALILFALICLPISFANEYDADQIDEASLESGSINQINGNVNLDEYSLNNGDICYSSGSGLNNGDICYSSGSGLNNGNMGYSTDSSSNIVNIHSMDPDTSNTVKHNMGDANPIDYNSPNLNTNFTNLNVTFTDENTIFVNASYDGSEESGTMEKPYRTLNAAYNNFSSGSNTKTNIFLANGLYTVTKSITISKSVNIIGESSLNTVISGGDNYQIFYITPPKTYGAVSPFVNIFNLTIRNGISYYGGAIYINESGVNFANVNFINNTARNSTLYYYSTNIYPGSGGAIYVDKSFVKFYNASFINNKALGSSDSYGGALFNDMGEITIINSQFINNTVRGQYGSGGAIYDYSGILVLFNSTVSNNTVNSNLSMGGGISTWASHNVYILNSTIDSNKLYGDYTFGSAIINKANYLIITNTTISKNLANGTSDINGTLFNLNGVVNSSNLQFINNIVKDPQNLFMCLEDQLIVERAFDDESLVNLPSKYDLRDYGLVTPIKDQGGSGSCWAFSTLGALESYLLKYENISYDFSENNMKNLMGIYGLNGTDWADGGNYYMALAYLLRWSGPVNETQDPFDDTSTSSKSNLNLTKYVQDVLYIPVRLNYLDINQIKAALMKYGALYTSMHADNSFQYNPDYYYDIISVSNHAVTLIGWDDNYSADNFIVKPPGDGAFIIKNSWGDDHGYDGYWYVSYYDKSFAGYGLDTLSAMAFTNVENVTAYKTNYQYDILGNTFESIGFGCSTAWFANQFKAKNNNPLTAFGLYTYGDSSYLANITVNGVEKYVQEGVIKGAGYHTVKLDEFVELTKNDIFRVAVKLTTPISLFPVAIESQRSSYSSGAEAGEGQSFISSDGINWYDLSSYNQVIKFYQYAYDETLNETNVCLKAYASGYADVFLNIKSNATVYNPGDIIEITLYITNEGEPVNDVNITAIFDDAIPIKSAIYYKGSFDYSSKVWHLDSLNKDETLTLKLKLSMNKIKKDFSTTFTFNHSGYIPSNASSSASLDFYFAGLTSFAQVDNISTIAKSQKEVLIKLVDWNSSPIANKTVLISLAEKRIDHGINLFKEVIDFDFEPIALITDDEGKVRFSLDLPSGEFKFLASFEGDDPYDPSNMTFNVIASKISTEIKMIGIEDLSNITTFAKSNDEIRFSLIDEASNVIKNKTIILMNTQSNQLYMIGNDEDGIFKFNLNLTEGTHVFDLDFFSDEIYNSSSLSFTVNVMKKDSPIISIEKDILSVFDSLKIRLNDKEGEGLGGKLLKINLTNKRGISSSILAFTDCNGIVEFYNLYQGAYNISISFENDDVYDDASLNSSFAVYKKETRIIFENMVTTAIGQTDGRTGEYFYFNLTDADGNPIANTPMQIGFNGKVYDYEHNNISTDENGTAKLQINLGYKGDYTFAICFLGNDEYEASFAVAKITVNTQSGSLEVPDKSYKANAKTKTLTATFKTDKGNPIVGKSVKFTVNGKTYSSKTDENGVATVKVSLNKKGTYNFTVKYGGDSTYAAVTQKAKLTIK